MTSTYYIYAHDVSANDLPALIERLRTVDDVRYDCCLISWQQARALAAHIDKLNDTIRQLADRVADQSEALTRRAEK